MTDQRSPLARSPYPQVENGPINDPTPRDQAIYVPAVSTNYIIDAYDNPFGLATAETTAPGTGTPRSRLAAS